MVSAPTTPLLPLPENDETLIRARDLPAYVGIAEQTLARWRSEGVGPEFIKLGRLVAYRVGAIREWLASHRRNCPA